MVISAWIHNVHIYKKLLWTVIGQLLLDFWKSHNWKHGLLSIFSSFRREDNQLMLRSLGQAQFLFFVRWQAEIKWIKYFVCCRCRLSQSTKYFKIMILPYRHLMLIQCLSQHQCYVEPLLLSISRVFLLFNIQVTQTHLTSRECTMSVK